MIMTTVTGHSFPWTTFFSLLKVFGVWRFLMRPKLMYKFFTIYSFLLISIPQNTSHSTPIRTQINPFNAKQKPEIERDNLPDRSATSRQHHFYCELEIPHHL